MNILFLTIGQIHSLKERSVHLDLINRLIERGHNVTVVATREKRLNLPTECTQENGAKIVRLKVGNLTKCSTIEKGISTLRIEGQFVKGIKKFLKNDKYDLVIYNTPPITLAKAVKFCKKKFNAKSYLMLKDIFPQNAIDIAMMSKKGLSGFLYSMFRKKEKQLYKYSDKIGCMSEANVEYVLAHNPEIKRENTEIFPNAVILRDNVVTKNKQSLASLQIPTDKTVFMYGGNLGKPQGLEFLVRGILNCKDVNAHFVIVGNGSEREKLLKAVQNLSNVTMLSELPANEYLDLCNNCDVGIICLDYRFTIPNYPSRVLAYMENSMPILACTDKATDIKQLVESDQANCGKWCFSNDIEAFKSNVKWFCENQSQFETLGRNGRDFLEKYFNVDICVRKLEKFIERK